MQAQSIVQSSTVRNTVVGKTVEAVKVVAALLLTFPVSSNAFAIGLSEAPGAETPKAEAAPANPDAAAETAARKVAWLQAGRQGCENLINGGSRSAVKKFGVFTNGVIYLVLAERQNGEVCQCKYSDHAMTEQEVGYSCDREI